MDKGIYNAPSLFEFYSRPYDESAHEWRSLGAQDKSTQIIKMATMVDHPISSVLEVGCGTGDVLRELARKNFSERLFGIEIGPLHSEEKKELLIIEPFKSVHTMGRIYLLKMNFLTLFIRLMFLSMCLTSVYIFQSYEGFPQNGCM